MVCLLFAGSFIGDAAPAVIPHLRLGTVLSAQPATSPTLQAHHFTFPGGAQSVGSHKV
jgi:hypothetical protein